MSLTSTKTFDAGADGVTLVSGNEGSVAISGTVKYETDAGVHGGRGIQAALNAASLGWSVPSSGQASIYWTGYGIGTGSNVFWSLRSSGTIRTRLRLNSTTGKYEITDNANTVAATSTASINALTPGRADIRWVWNSGASTLVLTVRLYLGANIEGDTPDETMTTAAMTLPAAVDRFYLGTTAASWTTNLDTVRLYDDVVTWPEAFVVEEPPPDPVLNYAMSGNIVDTTGTVTAKVTDTTLVKLRYSTSSIMASPSTTASATPDGDGYVRWDLTGLTANTKYYYQLTDTVDSVETAFGEICSFRTLPAPSGSTTVKLAVGSCVFTGAPNPHQALLDIVGWDPHLFVHLGDAYYSGVSTSTLASQHRGRWETQIAAVADWRTLLQSVGLVYTNSDHELNPDNADSNNDNGLSFNEFYRQTIPSYPLVTTGTNPKSKHHSWVDSNIRFIMIDVKNHDRTTGITADGPSKTMLGADQLAWLLDELSQPELLKVIFCDVPWSRAAIVNSTNQDKWWSYDTERTIIGDYIEANGINVDFYHGDSHRLSVDETHNAWGGFPVSSCAPLSQTAGGNQSDGYWDQTFGSGGADMSVYMRVTYEWLDSDTLQRTASGWDAIADLERVSMVTTWVREEAPPVNPYIKVGSSAVPTSLFRNVGGEPVAVSAITIAP